MGTYVDKVLAGEAKPLEIDNYIKEWHNSDSRFLLYEYLGLTKEEYIILLEQGEAGLDRVLKSIRLMRRFRDLEFKE